MMRPERDLDKIAKGWTIAMAYSAKRLKSLHGWQDRELETAARQGKLVLETTCLFVHACVKHGQYQYGFWFPSFLSVFLLIPSFLPSFFFLPFFLLPP